MLTLLAECHFWTNSNDININDNDYGAFKYYTKKNFQYNNNNNDNNLLAEAKKEYHENRNGLVIIKNDKELRFKDNLRKLDDLIKTNQIIKLQWKNSCIIQILLSNGIIIYICVNLMTGDILNMKYDKYFVGKLASDKITDAIFSHDYILLSYDTNQLTLVNFQKPNNHKCPEKITNMEPKILHILLPGQTDKKIDRNLIINNNYDLIVVWTKSSQSELFPWRPTNEDQEHSNMHVFKMKCGKLETIGYCWTENEPICVQILVKNHGKILTIEQKLSRKGDYTAEICCYIIGKNRKLSRNDIKTIPIHTQISCCSLSPDEEKILIGTIDHLIYICDFLRSTNKILTRSDIIPRQCVWHPDSAILIIADDRSHFQCFDFALNSISMKLTGKNIKPSNLLDLSNYFLVNSNLLNISFSRKPEFNHPLHKYVQTECFLILLYENGPIVCLRFFINTRILGDINSNDLTFDILCYQYLQTDQLQNCVKLLCSTNWEIYGSMCLLTLQRITNYVLKQIKNQQNYRELLLQALESFTDDLKEEVRDKYCDAIIDMKRRYFFYLLRQKLYQDCFDLAQNIEEYDLFMDLYNCTKLDTKLIEFSNLAYEQAKLILQQSENDQHSENDDDTISTSSQSSLHSDYLKKYTGNLHKNIPCTTASAQLLSVKRYRQKSDMDNKFLFKTIHSTKAGVSNLKDYVPPLPYFKSPILNAENVKINTPKLKIKSAPIRFEKYNENQSFVEEFQHLKIPSYPELNTNVDEIEFSSIHIPNTSKTYSNHSNSPQYNTRNQESLTNRDNYQLGIISTSFNDSEDELPLNWSNIPDQTIGIPTMSSESFKYHSSPLSDLRSHHRNSAELSGGQTEIYSSNSSAFTLKNNSPENIYSSKYYQNPLVLRNKPLSSINNSSNVGIDVLLKNKKPSSSILSNSSSNASSLGGFKESVSNEQNSAINGNLHKKEISERNKVKFSETVHVALVPENLRKDLTKKSKHKSLVDPNKELADSLPLCHPNYDYLKDFNLSLENVTTNDLANNNTEQRTEINISSNNSISISNNDDNINSNNNSAPSKIKVVHFGVV